MKKAVFLALALAAISGVFAQTPGLTFGTWGYAQGTFNTPVLFEIYDEAYISYRKREVGLNTTFTTSVKWNSGTITGPNLDFQNFTLSYAPNSFLKALAGKLVESGDAVLSSYINGYKFSRLIANTEPGILVLLFPARELTLSAFTPFTESEILGTIKKSSFGMKLAIPKVANFVASYRLREHEFAAGLDLRMVSDLTFKIGFKHFTLPARQAGVMFTVNRRFGGLNLALDGNVKIIPEIAFGVEGLIEYTIGNYTFGTVNSYDTKDLWYGNNGAILSVFVRRDFSAGSVRASVRYNMPTKDWVMPFTFAIFF